MAKCIIIAAGDFDLKEIKKEEDDLLIVADAGYKNFLKLKNLKKEDIDIVIGDFDSYSLDKMDLSACTRVITLNKIKDDSDSFDAVKEGEKAGYTEFYLYGMLGKRLEHTLSNIGILSYLKNKGKYGCILSNKTKIEILNDEIKEYSDKEKGYISIFPYIGEPIITIKGLKYELDNYKMDYANPSLGLDNEFIGKVATIKVKEAMVIAIKTVK